MSEGREDNDELRSMERFGYEDTHHVGTSLLPAQPITRAKGK